jgi:hypothetical protein
MVDTYPRKKMGREGEREREREKLEEREKRE